MVERMARALDALPACSWFLGLDLRTAALIIATLGIVHPMAYVYSCLLYRSPLFLTIWALVGAWAVASAGLFAGILQSSEPLYSAWIWFSLVFAALLALLMLVLLGASCRRRAPAAALLALLGALYYCMTFYCIFVVNSHRVQAFPSRS